MQTRIIISGGGTGGHIFPAIAIADAIKKQRPDAEILFVGALGKMEMERVPKAGYPIQGLPVVGFQRKLTLKNLVFPFKLMNSLLKARSIVRRFQPDVAVGVGGYASGPLLRIANNQGVPTLIQEQNSYAGVTNRILATKAKTICIAYENVRRFFPQEKTVFTGNPVRQDIVSIGQNRPALESLRKEAYDFYGLKNGKKTLLVVGGSLGARTLNQSMAAQLEAFQREDIQVLWQAGKLYIDEYAPLVEKLSNVKIVAFIERMDFAYAMADVVVSRAGALSISELCLLGKPSIFVPSPNVAEDHQTANAMALVEKNAGVLVKDADALTTLVPTAINLLDQQDKREELSSNILKLGIADSAERIANEVIKLIK